MKRNPWRAASGSCSGSYQHFAFVLATLGVMAFYLVSFIVNLFGPEVTFLREPGHAKLELPIELDGARILAVHDREIYTAYVPSPRGAVFMGLIEKTFGTNVTTRTWDTVRKCAAA